MNFVKMEGCANDFIVTNDLTEDTIRNISSKARYICDRRLGIGGDGIIALLPSSVADLKMRIINADGSEAEMCGNGIRCLALFAKQMELSTKPALRIETGAGIIGTEFVDDDIKVNMGPPILEGDKIPVAKAGKPIVEEKITAGNRTFEITAVSMGNPHAVIHVNEITDELVLDYGRILESHSFFPNKTNVEFISIISDNEIRMRVFERGVGETMACGTGACASVVAGILNRKHGNNVLVHLLGGDLRIEWDGDEKSPVFMTGPARWVFEGSVTV
ncbi:MAG: diaminopimelate epimerase [Chitinivibrionales bacterium]|nr:diaminopimelate epimerase [Chitinivibrionales bacterium]